MAEVPRSSFIPKQNPGNVPGTARRKRRINLFGIFSTVLIIAALISVGIVYGIKEIALRDLESQEQAFIEQRDSFNEAEIASVREMNRRINAGKFLIDNHLSPSRVFDALELDTLVTSRFGSFSFANAGDGTAEIVLSGFTDKLGSVLVQSRQFGENIVLQGAQITNASRGSSEDDANTGEVTFGVSAEIPTDTIKYQVERLSQTARNEAVLTEVTDQTATGTSGSDEVTSDNTTE